MRSFYRLAGLVVGLLGMASAVAAEPPCTRSIYVSVIDQKTSRPVPGLTPADFRVRSKGTDVGVRAVAPGPQHRRVVIVVDRSGSMQSDNPQKRDDGKGNAVVRSVAHVANSLPNDTSVALLEFGAHSRNTVGFTDGPQEMLRRSNVIDWKPEGRDGQLTPLWDNIGAAIDMLQPVSPADLIVVISDGVDNASRLSSDAVGRRLLQEGITLVTVLFALQGRSPPTPEEELALKSLPDLARKSGGATFILDDWREDSRVLSAGSAVGTFLAAQYRLDLEGLPAGKQRKLHLEVVSDKAKSRPVSVFYPQYVMPCGVTPK